MKIDKKSKILLFATVFVMVLIALQTLNINNDEQMVIDDKTNDKTNDIPINTPKSAGNWELTSVVLINDSATGVGAQNWTWAIAQDWCSGVGNSTHPFLIENVSIAVGSADPGLKIINSNSTTYFKLSNITITNTVGDGLELNSVSNCTIISSEFNNNGGTGINMTNANSTSITLTYCLNNTMDGIYAVNSSLNTFTVDCTNNTRYGLMLASCDNNTITLSDFFDNVGAGVVIIEIGENNSVYNEIYGNTFENNTLNGVDNCTIANQWDNGVSLGNNWDDYDGVDVNDDLIGDTAYDVSGSAEAVDNYPYCNDGIEPVTHDHTERDLWKPFDPIRLAILIGVLFGVFVSILLVSNSFYLKDGNSNQ